MSDGISKPTHTNEDKTKYDAEYNRIFGFEVVGKSGAKYKVKVDGNRIVECKKLSNPEFDNEEHLIKLVKEDLMLIQKEYGTYSSKGKKK